MFKVVKLNLVLLLFVFVELSSSVYTPSITIQKKPHLTPGIKTAGWRNQPTSNILIHHNYSHVNYQNPNAGNALTHDQIVRSTTERIYPIYKQDLNQGTPATNAAGQEDGTHPKVIIRVKKQLQTYEKCPSGMTGQLVYSLSCNQFLNCWKGRSFVQNCSPGTLFNPDTLSCDFPEKVRCITGPRRTIFEEPPPTFSHTLNTRNTQPKCPEDFSGRMPNYSNCSKFVVCMQGKAMNQLCPPGTLFDINRNVCDFPKIAKCFNGENQGSQKQNVDYFVMGSSNQIAGQYQPTIPLFYQTKYDTNGNCGNAKGCARPFSTHPPDGGDSGFLPGPNRQYPINNCIPPNCNPSGPSYTNRNGRKPIFIETVNRPSFGSDDQLPNGRIDLPQNVRCDPSISNCRTQNTPPRENNEGLYYRKSSGISNRNIAYGCNLQTLECIDPPNTGYHQPESGPKPNYAIEGNIIRPSYSGPNRNGVRFISNCNQQNCGESPNSNIQQGYPIQPPTIHQSNQRAYSLNNQGRGYTPFKPTDKPSTINSKNIFSGQPRVQCPPGATGVNAHPYNCSLFLNCANGQTFIMSCGPGTLFNEAIMACDHAYNVECNHKGVIEPDGNNLQPFTTPRTTPTTTTYDHEEMTTSYTYLHPVTSNQRGNYITRPPKSQTFHKVSDYEDVGPSSYGFTKRTPVDPVENVDQNCIGDNKRQIPKNPTKTWPPPFPATDTNADYVYEYLQADLEPEIGAENGDKNTRKVCSSKNGFLCSSSRCISKDLVCNGFKDCPDGRDESGCFDFLSKFDVSKDTRLAVTERERWDNVTNTACAYMCLESNKFECKSFNYRKIDNCCLLSDKNEGLTGRLMSYPPNDYYELKSSRLDCSNMFQCNNKKCIEKTQVCDGQDDCGDREDEKNCPAEKIGYSIRLNGGNKPWEGRIEVSAFGRTGYVCDDRFDIRDANVVCKELGYHLGASETKANSIFAKDVPPEKVFYMMDDVMCLGNETSLKECDFNGWGSHDCTNEEVVGVVCNGLQDKCPDQFWKCRETNECVPMAFVCDGLEDCSDGSEETDEICKAPVEVRLVNGTTRAEGRVEVLYHDVWGTVCDDDFNEDAAKVVCKSLGYNGTVAVKKEAYFGKGKGQIWLDQVSCFGNESRVDKCTHWKWGEHNCDHSEDVGVICSSSDTSGIERHVQKPLEINSSSTATLPSYPIYPETCGLRKNSIFTADRSVHFRVVQGSKATVGDYPWQAAIRVKGKLRTAHWCGAVIISSKFVLTAAHCLVGYPKGAYIVVAGDYNIEEDEGTEQFAYMEDFYVHEDFRRGQKMNNDIALVKLKGQGFRLSQDVQAICLPDEDTDYDTDMNCTISGFGSIESGVSAFSNELRAGTVPLLPKTVCTMPHVYGNSLTDGMFCAGYLDGGTDACDGDSGGPLACLDHGLFTLYGITSWGHRCGYANKPGVYVRVAHYRKWIDDIIKKSV